MLYAILAYHVEADVMSWTPEEDAALMTNLLAVHDRLNEKKLLGPAARLGATADARTLRGPGNGMVLDGPFAETKEQLLGLYVVNCTDEAEAIRVARDLRRVNPDGGLRDPADQALSAGRAVAGERVNRRATPLAASRLRRELPQRRRQSLISRRPSEQPPVQDGAASSERNCRGVRPVHRLNACVSEETSRYPSSHAISETGSASSSR